MADNHTIASLWFLKNGLKGNADVELKEHDRLGEFVTDAADIPDYTGPDDTFFTYGDGCGHGVCLVEYGKVIAGAIGGESIETFRCNYAYYTVKVVEGSNVGSEHEWTNDPSDHSSTGIMEFYRLLRGEDPYEED